MTELYDSEGRALVYEDSGEMTKAVGTGQFGFKKGTRVNVFDPANPDDVFSIPAEEAQTAVSEGLQFETTFGKGVRESVEEGKGFIGGVKVGVGELVNGLTFGVPETIMKNTMSPFNWAKVQGWRDEHETAALVGSLGGMGANVYALAKSGILGATEQLAKRLTANIGKQTVGSAERAAAKNILEKTARGMKKGSGVIARNAAQGAIEGAADMAIPAGAELMFGNGEEAAETMLLGMGFGGVLSGALRTGGDMLGAAKRMAPGDSTVIQEKLIDGISTAINKPADDIRYGLENAKAVREAKSFQENYRAVSTAQEIEATKFNDAVRKVDNSETVLKGQTQQRKEEMEYILSRETPIVAERLEGDVQNVKTWLHEKSIEADDILAEQIPDPFIERSTLTKALDRAASLMERLPSDADIATRNSIMRLSKNVTEMNPELMTGSQARDVLQSLRRDINYNQLFADFDARKNQVLKTVTHEFSEEIKEFAPQYAEAMAEMAPKAQLLADLNKHLGNEGRRRALAKTLVQKPDSKIAEKMSEFFESVKTIDGMEDIDLVYKELTKDQRSADLYKSAFKRVGKTKTKDQFYQEQFPEEYGVMQMAKEELDLAQADFDRLSPLIGTKGTKDTESMLSSNLDSPKKGTKLREAIDFLGERHPELADLRKRLKDTRINHVLGTASPQGSRSTNMYAHLAGGVGAFTGPMGWAMTQGLGAVAGGYVDRFGGKSFLKLLQDNPSANKMRAFLVAEEQLGKFAKAADTIPARLQNLAEGAPTEIRATGIRKVNATTNQLILKLLRGVRADERDKEIKKEQKEHDQGLLDKATRVRAYEAYREMHVKLMSDPEQKTQALGEIGGEMLQGGAPGIASHMMQKMDDGLQYLDMAIPKDPMPIAPWYDRKWEPSDYDLRAWEEKLVTVWEPMVVFDALDGGVLSRNHVEALQVVYPSLYQHIQGKVIETLEEDKPKISYEKRIGLGYILDMPIDPTASDDSFAYYQGVTKPEPLPEEPEEGSYRPNIGKTNTRQLLSRSSQIRGET